MAETSLTDLKSQLANLRYAINSPSEFPPFDMAAYQKGVRDAETAINDTRYTIKKCVYRPDNCEPFVPVSVSLPAVPDRPDGPTRAELASKVSNLQSKWQQFFGSRDTFGGWCSLNFPRGIDNGFQFIGCVGAFDRYIQWCASNGCIP